MPTTSYPFDTTGLAASNLITGEIQTIMSVNDREYYMVIPDIAPFYANEKLIITAESVGSTITLVEGKDYFLTLPYIAASRSIGKTIYGGIAIINHTLNASVVLQYQTLGGDWIVDRKDILETFAEKLYNPRTVVWDLVVEKPATFPPINHSLDVEEIYGQKELIEAILSVASEIAKSDRSSFLAHKLDISNPHGVTKEQVFLGNVENLPVASETDIADLKLVRKYTTLDQVLGLFKTFGNVFTPTVNTYTLTSVDTLNEGSDLAVSLVTTGVPDGRVLYWKLANGTTKADDFQNTSGSVVVYDNKADFVVRAVNDVWWENAEGFQVEIHDTAGSGSTLLTAGPVVALINSANGPVYSITPAKTTVKEASKLEINVSATRLQDGTTLNWQIVHNTTTADDFVRSTGVVYINQNSGLFEIETTADEVYETDKKFKVKLTNAAGTQLAITGDIVLKNITNVATYQVTSSQIKVNEGGTFNLNVSGTNIPNGTVLSWVVNHVGTVDADFTAITGTVTINNNLGLFNVTTSTNSFYYPDKTFTVSIKSGTPATVVQATTGTLTIQDTTPVTYRAQVDKTTTSEGGTFRVDIETTGLLDATLLYWSIAHNTTLSADFDKTSGSVAIVANAASFTIKTLTDFSQETIETFQVVIRSGSDKGPAVATISSLSISDAAPTASFTALPTTGSVTSDGTVLLNEGTNFTMTVTGTSEPFLSTVYWKVKHGTTVDSNFTATAGSVSMSANNTGTLDIETVPSVLYSGDKTFSVEFYSNPEMTTPIGGVQNLLIVDTSVVTYALSAFASKMDEGKIVKGQVITTNVQDGMVVFWSILHVGTNDQDFEAVSGTAVVKGNKATFDIKTASDTIWESSETFKVQIRKTSPSGDVVATSNLIKITESYMDLYTSCCVYDAGVNARSYFLLGRM